MKNRFRAKRGRNGNHLPEDDDNGDDEEESTSSLRHVHSSSSATVSNGNDGNVVEGRTTVKIVNAPRTPASSASDTSRKDGVGVDLGGSGKRSCGIICPSTPPENIVASHLVSTVLSPMMMTTTAPKRRALHPNYRPLSSLDNDHNKLFPSNDASCDCDFLLSYLNSLLLPSSDDSEGIGGRRTSTAGNQGQRLRQILDSHNFRTSFVTSPTETSMSGPAVSIYRDSCHVFHDGYPDGDRSEEEEAEGQQQERLNGKEFLLIAFGLHHDQDKLEKAYKIFFRRQVCVFLFIKSVRDMVETTMAELRDNTVDSIRIDTSDLERQLQEVETNIVSTLKRNCINGDLDDFTTYPSEFDTQRKIDTMMRETVRRLDSKIRSEVLQREYQRINSSSCTLANVLMTHFVSMHHFCVRDIEWKPVPLAPRYERITVHFSNSNTSRDLSSSSFFTSIPSLSIVLNRGPDNLVEKMVRSLWTYMLRYGYVPSTHMKESLHCSLCSFFRSGLGIEKNGNESLKSQFLPTYPFSAYIHGEPGTGKSSFARIFPLALQETLEEHVDPDISVRMVKQNLNKPQHILQVSILPSPF